MFITPPTGRSLAGISTIPASLPLLLQAPEAGGEFQYVRTFATPMGELNFKGVADVLDGRGTVETLDTSRERWCCSVVGIRCTG